MALMKSSCLVPANRILYTAFCPNRVKSEDRNFFVYTEKALLSSELTLTDTPAPLSEGEGLGTIIY